jgi:membrane protein involved in colicin uptake
MKEPALEYGRAVDRAVASHKDELDREDGRITALVSEFKLAERARIAEEERLQAAELARIEREKQAELKRIADEATRVATEVKRVQDEIDRVAQAAKAKADSEAAAATNQKQREAAAARQAEAQKLAQAAEAARKETETRINAEAVRASTAAEAVKTKAGELAYLESRPILTTKAHGQSEREDWDVEIINPYELAKFHPDCVTITPLMGKIKGVLNEGREVHGVKAKKILKTNQRAEKSKLIDI